jgi:spore photoproduct lyase
MFTQTPPGIVCPHFYVLAHANGCPFACDYCFLQLTFRYARQRVVFNNRKDLLRQVEAFLKQPTPAVLNAGELSDGLAFDDVTGLSKDLVALFSAQERHKLLFLTKSTTIRNLLEAPQHRNVIISFSVNAPQVSARFERAAPSPLERLKAAQECQRAGYEVRLRVDPIIPVKGWRQEYGELVTAMTERLDLSNTRLTLGSIRYFQPLPQCAQRRGRETDVFSFAKRRDGDDGRFRLDIAQRLEIYQWFQYNLPPTASLALCKETVQLWRELGWDRHSPKCNCAL